MPQKPLHLVIASTNTDKLKEVKAIFQDHKNITIIPMSEIGHVKEIVEDGNSFEANALIKARTIAEETDYPVIADDSGLAVDALDGAPGIYSARFEGLKTPEERNRRLLEKLENVPEGKRGARFISVVAYIDENRTEHLFRGEVEGVISHMCIGEHGFGYDPLFYLTDYKRTMADLTPEVKNSISHRKKALEKFKKFIMDKRS